MTNISDLEIYEKQPVYSEKKPTYPSHSRVQVKLMEIFQSAEHQPSTIKANIIIQIVPGRAELMKFGLISIQDCCPFLLLSAFPDNNQNSPCDVSIKEKEQVWSYVCVEWPTNMHTLIYPGVCCQMECITAVFCMLLFQQRN